MLKYILSSVLVVMFLGCSTWQGVKEDAHDAKEWSKEKVNDGATYVKEKTE